MQLTGGEYVSISHTITQYLQASFSLLQRHPITAATHPRNSAKYGHAISGRSTSGEDPHSPRVRESVSQRRRHWAVSRSSGAGRNDYIYSKGVCIPSFIPPSSTRDLETHLYQQRWHPLKRLSRGTQSPVSIHLSEAEGVS